MWMVRSWYGEDGYLRSGVRDDGYHQIGDLNEVCGGLIHDHLGGECCGDLIHGHLGVGEGCGDL